MESKSTQTETADPFLAIKGIGPGKAGQLRAAGVQTMTQLANMTPEALAAIVSGASPHTIRRDRWLEQARILAQQASLPNDDRQRYATFSLELLLDENRNVRRTRIEHMQSGEKRKWAYWNDARMLAFIREQAGLTTTVSPPAQVAAVVVEPAASRLQVQQLRILPVGADRPRAVLPAGSQFAVELVLGLPPLDGLPETAVRFTVAVLAYELGGARQQVVGRCEGRLAQPDSLEVTVPGDAPLPGTYRLEVVVDLVTAVPGSQKPTTLLHAAGRAEHSYLYVFGAR